MMYLRQATSVDVPVGPFLDETDGKTAETALTITQPDVRLKKNNGNWAQKAAAQTLTHEENGWYEVTLDATDTDTCGHLVVAIHESGALPVWREFTVLEEAIYDALFAASASAWSGAAGSSIGVANVTQVDGSALDTHDAGSFPADVRTWVGTAPLALASQRVQVSVGEMQSNVINSSSISVTGQNSIGSAVWDMDATSHQTQGTFGQAIGDPAADSNTIWGSIHSASFGLAVIESQTDDIGVAGAGLTGIPWNASWDAEVQSEVQDALDGTIADSIPADGTRPSISSGIYMICQGLFEGSISGTTWTVKKVDGSTTLFTVTLDSATTPTSKARAT